jgi:Zn finger protein HypA/HybF involved in hydrogenase expression
MCFYNEHKYYEDLEAEAKIEAEAEAMNQECFKPKKPKYDYKKHLYICPNCGKFLQTYNAHQKYSMCCGQLLDWD